MRCKDILLVATLALGCAGAPTYPSSLDGAWREDLTLPGNSLQFTLTTNRNAVSGSGTWTGEACCSGAVTITGDAATAEVNLTFVFVAMGGAVPPRTSRFAGRATDINTLSGLLVTGGYSSPTTFRRVR